MIRPLNLIDQFESLVLLLGHNIEIFLVNLLALPLCVAPLNPSVIPVHVSHLAGHVNLPVLHRKQCAVLSKTHVQSRMESGVPLCGQDGSCGHCVSILNAPAPVLGPRLSVDIFRTSAGLFTRVTDKLCNDFSLNVIAGVPLYNTHLVLRSWWSQAPAWTSY